MLPLLRSYRFAQLQFVYGLIRKINNLAVGLMPQVLIELPVNVFLEKVSRSIGHDKDGSAWVTALESESAAPVVRVMASIVVLLCIVAAAIEIDRRYRANEPLAIVRPRPPVPQRSTALGADFAKH